MKQFVFPEIKVMRFYVQDVITTSNNELAITPLEIGDLSDYSED